MGYTLNEAFEMGASLEELFEMAEIAIEEWEEEEA